MRLLQRHSLIIVVVVVVVVAVAVAVTVVMVGNTKYPHPQNSRLSSFENNTGPTNTLTRPCIEMRTRIYREMSMRTHKGERKQTTYISI